MSFFNETYCQLCERFITKEQWDKHLSSSRHLHREMNGLWQEYIPQKKTTAKNSIPEEAFWEMIFGNEDILPVYGFLKTYIMMVTLMEDYLTFDDNGDVAVFRYNYRDILIAQFEQDLYNKGFSHQSQNKREDGLQ